MPKHNKYCTSLTKIAEPNDILFSVRATVGQLNITLDKIVIGRGLAAIRNKEGFQSFQYYHLKNLFYKKDLIGGALFLLLSQRKSWRTKK